MAFRMTVRWSVIRKRLPDLPVGEQYRFSFGVQQDLSEVLTASFSYTLIWSGPGNVDPVPLPPDGAVVLDSDYDPNFIHVLGFTFTGRFVSKMLAKRRVGGRMRNAEQPPGEGKIFVFSTFAF
ncbi:hypothetical protein NKDENANG_02261 [Candidatus Entotheonellaceae bacterium PAL068K]